MQPVLAYANADKWTMRFKGYEDIAFDWYGLHRYDAARGNKYGLALFDEAAHSPNLEPAWQFVVRPSLSDYRGGAWFASTPKGDNYFKKLEDEAQDDADWMCWHEPTNNNPLIALDEIEAARKSMPSVVFRQEYLAEYVTLQGNRIKREWLRYEQPPDGCTYFVGVDLAISKKTAADYTTMVVVGMKDSKYYVVDVLRMKESFNEVLTAIKNLAAKWKPNKIVIEAVAYQAAMVQELIRTTSLPVKPITPSKDKITRFLHVEGKYEHGYIYHASGLIPEFERELLSFPNSEHDDMCDALCYAITTKQAAGYF